MPRDKGWSIRPLLQVIAGACLLVALVMDPGCHANHEVTLVDAKPIKSARSEPPMAKSAASETSSKTGKMTATNSHVEAASVISDASSSSAHARTVRGTHADSMVALLRRDPLEALRQLHRDFAERDPSYTCVFTRQELLGTGMGPEQEIAVKFRSVPFSVAMEFTRNAGLVKRALFVQGKWRDESADPELKDQAFVQPAGVAGLLVKSIKQPIHGTLAKRTGRRAIDQFGFERAMKLIVDYCEKADARGELKLTYEGEGEFKGRRVWVLKRVLPYSGPDGEYPDRVAKIYIDEALRVPVAIHTFSDDQCDAAHLLGKYEYRDIDFDANVTDADFEPATYGL